MNADVKKKWLEALRSGEYEQTTGKLHRIRPTEIERQNGVTAGYCCLGVLCDIAAKEGVVAGRLAFQYGSELEAFSGSDSVLPAEVMLWAELAGPNPDVSLRDFPELLTKLNYEHETLALSLATINDEGATFAEIADVIEEVL